MSFQPVVPFGGLAGWAFLQRTGEAQREAFSRGPVLGRETDRFLDRIGGIQSAEALVADRRLLSVALGAFGLGEDIGNRFFIRKVLEEGTIAPGSLANRLADKRYAAMAEAFGFDLQPPNSALSDFGPRIVAAFRAREFEGAVGAQSPDLRLALGFPREIADLAAKGLSENAMWFTVMATPPLRRVFEGAFNLPPVVGTLDIDRQLELFKDRARAAFGADSLSQFTDPETQSAILRRFLLSSESAAGPSAAAPGATALALLQASPRMGAFAASPAGLFGGYPGG